VRFTGQILATTATAAVIIGGSAAPAAAFWPQFQQYAAVTPQTEEGGSTLKTRRATVARTPATASRSQPPAVKSEPAASSLAAKVTGPLHIIVSLDRQELTLYSDGQPIARSRVSTGMRGHQTPTGVFSIIQKSRWHRSNIYSDAPMFFMQRITWSGIALHQGVVPNHPASHGCIRMPEAFARQLWTTTTMGARVIVAHGEVAPVAISHPKLFTPKRAPAISQAQAVRVAEETWTFAKLASKAPLIGATATDFPAVTVPESTTTARSRALKAGPVSVFISRKEGRLYVRKGFEPLFDVPVAIEQADRPLGTHVFTAMAQADDAETTRWTVVSMTAAPAGSPASAAGALDRIAIPQDARDQISELLTPGASLIISDQGLGPETGKGTDFIVLTR
jgi:lipoprotein-anchoring transpeptidase ErfK/SrfK